MIECLENSRAHLLTSSRNAIEAAHLTLTKCLINDSATAFHSIAEAESSKKEILRPLETERLQFAARNGKPAGIASLGERMKRFERLVKVTEKELEKLWADWESTVRELQKYGEDSSKERLDHRGQGQHASVEEDIIRERERLEKEVETFCGEILGKMVDSEKVCNALLN